MSPSFEVRQVEEADLPTLREHDPNPDATSIDQHFEHQGTGDSIFAVAWADDAPVGMVVLDLSESALLPELRDMYVYRAYRRQGVGHLLSAFVEDHARNLGYEAVFLGVDPENFQAIPLYLSIGYEPTGNHRVVEAEQDGEPTTFHDAIYRKSVRVQK